MSRRIRWLGAFMLLCFALVLVQLVNVQFRQAQALRSSPNNPRNVVKKYDNLRGDILAANGQILAESVPAPKGSGPYQYMRSYPMGSLFAQIVGFDDAFYGADAGVEYQYNSYLVAHNQKATTLSQLLAPPPPTTDDVTLTVEPYLQQVAQQALASIPASVDPSGNRDGAVVVLDVHTGAVLAMYSSPSYDPAPLASPNVATEEAAGHADFSTTDSEGFSGGLPIATFDRLFPGSTFKVVTTSAVYNLAPQLSNFTFKTAPCTGPLPDSNKQICNDAATPQAANPCGGTIPQMLPPSCDPGYAELGMALGAATLNRQAELFGYNTKPPIDLPDVVPSYFPPAADFQPQNLGLAGLAYSAFGQQNVQATALQQAMVAAAVADNGTVMTPHVMASIHNSSGQLVTSYHPRAWKQAMSPSAAQTVNQLMQSVVTSPDGTAYGVHDAAGVSLAALHAAVKTGTAQTGGTDPNTNTHDWMIGFAPANNPQVAVAVVVPYQQVSTSGAQVAGPIMATMLQAALNPPPGQ